MNGKRKNVSVVFVLPVLLGFLCLYFFFCFLSCKLKSTDMDTETDPAQDFSFSKIYDKEDKSNYTAVDIKQTGDGGYIILGRKDNQPYLLKVNGEGIFQWDTAEDEELKTYTNPIADLIIFNQNYYFFCNKEEDGDLKDLVLLTANENNHQPVPEDLTSRDVNKIFRFIHNIRPLHASKTFDNSFLLLAIDDRNDYLIFVKRNSDGTIKIGKRIYIEYRCVYSNPYQDKRFHITGVVGTPGNDDYYYFQSFFDDDKFSIKSSPCFTITTIREMADSNNGNVIDEFAQENPFIALYWDDANSYSYRAHIDDNIVTFSGSSEIGGTNEEEVHLQPELIAFKPVYIKAMKVNNERFVFFAGSSKDNRIVLYVYTYDPVNGTLEERFRVKKYFGHTHSYEAAGLLDTKYGGLAIIGTTYVAGRLGRICLFKLSKDDLENFVVSGDN